MFKNISVHLTTKCYCIPRKKKKKKSVSLNTILHLLGGGESTLWIKLEIPSIVYLIIYIKDGAHYMALMCCMFCINALVCTYLYCKTICLVEILPTCRRILKILQSLYLPHFFQFGLGDISVKHHVVEPHNLLLTKIVHSLGSRSDFQVFVMLFLNWKEIPVDIEWLSLVKDCSPNMCLTLC